MRLRIRCKEHAVPLTPTEGPPFFIREGKDWEVDLSDMACPEADTCGDSWVIEEVRDGQG